MLGFYTKSNTVCKTHHVSRRITTYKRKLRRRPEILRTGLTDTKFQHLTAMSIRPARKLSHLTGEKARDWSAGVQSAQAWHSDDIDKCY